MRLLLSAIEPSGDRLGAELIEALKQRNPQVEVEGIGGPWMQAAGLRTLEGARAPAAAMGLVEVLGHLGDIRHNRACLRGAIERKPDRFVGIDAPDFHLPLLGHARKKGIPAIGFVAPQIWAWRAGRAKSIAQQMDRLLCLFPFEPALFPGLDARWVGHPATERVSAAGRRPEEGCLAVLPGSRPAEILRLWPVFRETVERMGARRILLPLAPGRSAADFAPLPPGMELSDTATVLTVAEKALSKSGTATLELALAGIPTVVAHRVHPLTWLLGRLLIRGVRHLALPNVLLDRLHPIPAGPQAPLPEYIQFFTPAQLREALLQVGPPPAGILRQMLTVPEDSRRVAERAADAILSA